MFIYYVVIYFLDLYKDWNTLFASEEIEEKTTNKDRDEFESHKDSQASGFGDSNYDQESVECKFYFDFFCLKIINYFVIKLIFF